MLTASQGLKENNCIIVKLGKHNVLISAEDANLIEEFPHWRVRKDLRTMITRYIKTEWGCVRQDLYLSRAIVKPPNSFVVDHIDRNPLNNTRKNLRLATHSQNAVNKSKLKNKTSKYHGVSICRAANTNPWRIFMRVPNTKNKRISRSFSDEFLAAVTFDFLAKEYWGEFAPQNFTYPLNAEQNKKLKEFGWKIDETHGRFRLIRSE